MLIKFDHIAYTCLKREMDSCLLKCDDYKTVFREQGIPNLTIKQPLMDLWQADHDIALYESEKRMPVEMTAYDSVGLNLHKYDIDGLDDITVNTNSAQESRHFYETIGFKSCNGKLCLSFPIGYSPIRLSVREVNVKEVKLCEHTIDREGYCCLAFVAYNVVREKERLSLAGIEVTEIMSLMLHGSKLKIFFAYNYQGDICEIIGIEK